MDRLQLGSFWQKGFKVIRKALTGICLVGLVIMMSACSAADALNAVIPSGGYTRHTDLAYGTNPRQALDVYQPAGAPPPGGRTIVVFFYGGSWRNGKRETYRFVAEALTSKGYVAVIPDYRVYPEVVFPIFVEDAAQALRWVADNAAHYGGNKDRIVLMGHSAGAHIAALSALDPQFLKAVDLPASTVKGVVGLAGPYSFDPLESRMTRTVFSHLKDVQVARPVTFAAQPAPPTLLLHGATDTTVGLHNSDDMASAMKAAGHTVTEIVYAKVGHIGIVAALAAPLRGYAPTLNDSAAFIDGLFGPTAEAAHAAQ